ncbi:MAG: hypothetical protein KAG61_11630 [Bacteriovoracaceae bacterium]|nr:hypothetical protein [Bacteriovoracaceae bacterium]
MKKLLILLYLISGGLFASTADMQKQSHLTTQEISPLANLLPNGLQKLKYSESRVTTDISSGFYYTDFESIANSWKSSFFTDDSKFYLKLHSDGFTQRIRFHRDFCAGVDSVDLVFKDNSARTKSFLLKRYYDYGWESLYGIDEDNYCWFELKASGIDLNRPENNLHVIQIVYNGTKYFLQGIGESLLPAKRIVQSLQDIIWTSLGAHGATPVTNGGVFFKLWEPEVDRVDIFVNSYRRAITLLPDFNKGTEIRSHSIYLTESSIGDEYYYQFMVDGKYLKDVVSNNMVPTAIKVDPMAKEIVYDGKGGKLNGYHRPRAVVQGDSSYVWHNDYSISELSKLNRDNRVIYQVWPLTFNPKKVNGKYISGTFSDIIDRISYIEDLGVNAVELLPIHESKFYAAWGYSLDSILLIEKGYGSSDSLRALSDSLHSKNIQLILDVVLNHVNNSLIRDPISQFDDQSKFFDGPTDWGPRPRFSSIGVQKWISDSLVSLVRDFHIDGYRFDMTKYIYNLGGNPAGYKFLQDLNYILKQVHPNIYLSAEELPDNVWVTKPQIEAGLGFDSQWNDKFKNFFEEEFTNYRPYNQHINLSPLLGTMYGYSNHTNYGTEYSFGEPQKTVNYLGSHDFIGNKNPILRLVSDYNFYEKVNDNYFSRVRPLEDPVYDRFALIHNDFNHSVGRAAYGILFTKPGSILFYQGEELGNDINIENEWSYIDAKQNNSIPSQNVDIHRFVGSHRMPWEYLDPFNSPELSFIKNEDKKLFSGYHNFFKDMIRFRYEHPKINFKNAYNIHLSSNGQIISYQVDSGMKQFFVIVNFGTNKNGEWVSFPRGGDSWWKELFNSSEEKYSGYKSSYRNVISSPGGRASHLRLKANTIMVYERSSRGSISVPLYLRSSMTNWGFGENQQLINSSEHGDVYSLTINVKKKGEYDFKIGTSNWDLEYGSPTRGANVEHFGRDITGQLSNRSNMPNFRIKLEKGRYKFLFNIVDFKFSLLYID